MPMVPGRGVGLVVFSLSFLLDPGVSFGSGASRSSTPRLARFRMRTHRITSIEHPSSTTAVAKHPPRAGPKGTTTATESCDASSPDGVGMGGEGAGKGATGGDEGGEGGGGSGDGDMAGWAGGKSFSHPGQSHTPSSTQVHVSPTQRSGLHIANCRPARRWQPLVGPRQQCGGSQQLS